MLTATEGAGYPTGFPRAIYAIQVSVPLSVDEPRTRRQFCDNVKPFPASIAQCMLQAGMGLDAGIGDVNNRGTPQFSF